MSHPFSTREDLIGKRIIIFRRGANDASAQSSGVGRQGVIRASTAQNWQNSDTKALIEFDDDIGWRFRRWIELHDESNACLIEDTLVWARRHVGPSVKWTPALAFRSLKVKSDTGRNNLKCLEFLCDKTVVFKDQSSWKPFTVQDVSELANDDRQLVMPWISCHLSQLLLVGTPSLAVGRQVQVYNCLDDVAQWHTARVVAAYDQKKLMTLWDASELKERTVNAALIQITGLPMITDQKLWTTAHKLGMKRPSEEPISSPVNSKRTRGMDAEDNGAFSGQSEHSFTRSLAALPSTVPRSYEPLPELSSSRSFDGLLSTLPRSYEVPLRPFAEYLMTGNVHYVPLSQPSASLSKCVGSPASVGSAASQPRAGHQLNQAGEMIIDLVDDDNVMTSETLGNGETSASNRITTSQANQPRTSQQLDEAGEICQAPSAGGASSIRPSVSNCASASMHAPQSSNSTVTNTSSFRKFSSLLRYRHQPPAIFQARAPGFSSPGLRYDSPPVLLPVRTTLPLQETKAGVTSDEFCPKTPQNGICRPIRTRTDTHSMEESSFQRRAPENRRSCQERLEVRQLHIPVVIHSDRERRFSSPGNRSVRGASGGGGDSQTFLHNRSPVKSPNLIVVDLVEDDDTPTSETLGNEKFNASNRAAASQPRVGHQLNRTEEMVIDLVDDDDVMTSETLGSEKTNASNGITTSQVSGVTTSLASQPRASHQLNQAGEICQANQAKEIHQSNKTMANRQLYDTLMIRELNRVRVSQFAQNGQAQRNAFLKEMERFIGKKVEEAPKGGQKVGEAPKGGQKVGEAPKGSQKVGEAPKGSQKVGEAPKGSQKVEEAPKLSQKVEEAPKGSQKVGEAPKGSQKVEEAPKGSQKVEEAPKGSQKVEEAPKGSQKVEEAPKGSQKAEEASKGSQLIGHSSLQTSNEVILKYKLFKTISKHRSILASSTASTPPTQTAKELNADASAQRPHTLPRQTPTRKQSIETTPGIASPKSEEKISQLKNLKSPTKTLNSVRNIPGRLPIVSRIGASGNLKEDKHRQNVVKGIEEETQGLVGIMKLLKILDNDLVWIDSADVTMTTKERKKLLKNSVDSRHSDSVDSGHSESVNSGHSESVNSGHPESVNSRHSQFVSPRAKLPPHDCEIKIAQFKKSISDGLGKEYESPSCVLSKKSLNGADALLPKNSFVQEDSCLDLASAVTICRECKSAQKGQDRGTKILCRFIAFRRLNTTKKGTCKATGFCSPRDADGSDVSLWMPLVPITAPQIDVDMAKYIVKNVGNRFCELVEQEKEAMTWSFAFSEIVWKRPVDGVREMCDACRTTLFNVHWVCGKCGFVVCLDCFRSMTQKCATCTDEVGCKICDRGHNRWPRCTHSTRPLHVPSQLMLTQIIPSDVLWSVGRMIHDVRKKWKMFTNCPCGEDRQDCEADTELQRATDEESQQTVQDSRLTACTEIVSMDEKELHETVSSVPPETNNAVSKKSAQTEDHELLTSSSGKKEMNDKCSDVLLKNTNGKPLTSSSGKKHVPPNSDDSKRLTSSSGKKRMIKKVFDVPPTNGDSTPVMSSSNKKETSKAASKKSAKTDDHKPLMSSSEKKETNTKVSYVSMKNGDSKPLTSSPNEKDVDKKVFNESQTTSDTAGWKSPKNENEKPLTSSSSALRDMIMKNLCLADIKVECKTPNTKSQTLDDIAQRVVGNNKLHRLALTPRLLNLQDPPKQLCVMSRAKPITRNSLSMTQLQYPDVAHAWLDDGRLLQLLEPRHPSNIHLFQQQWKRGQPVLISKCQQYLNQDLWLPESFAKEFGDEENNLVDCSRKVNIVGHKMRRFWDGFESVTARLKDKHGQPMILKLKDWPPTADFSELLPSRFEDLLRSLPMPEYTHRTGVFNLVSRLPEFFVRPDLGPKMYNAYGSALYPQVGSTNLHLDVSDAVNLILYVGIPKDDKDDHEAAAVEAMKEAGCCELTMARILTGSEKPGALWHIFDPQDSDKIRDLLHKVASEVGEPIGPHHDPIHDQSWYLDEKLRRRLFAEYAVECYTLVQCVGDAIFIPAGAPHQVRNLHSCIKAAEDFVSPENLSYCFKLTQEFRHLSDKHSNHEDKLQVKNIIYHAVKDAIAVLLENDP